MQPSSENVLSAEESGLRHFVIRLGNAISTICTQLCGLSMAIIVLICTSNVIGRYFFQHAFSWAEEAMVYCMIFVIFFASAAVTWRGQHLSLNLLMPRFPVKVQKVISIIISLAAIALLLSLAWVSFDVVGRFYRFGQVSDSLRIPMWIPQGFVPCGLVLIALMMLLRLIAFDPVSKENEFNGEEHKL